MGSDDGPDWLNDLFAAPGKITPNQNTPKTGGDSVTDIGSGKITSTKIGNEIVTNIGSGEPSSTKNGNEIVTDIGSGKITSTKIGNEIVTDIGSGKITSTKIGNYYHLRGYRKRYDDRITDYFKRGEIYRKELFEKFGDLAGVHQIVCHWCKFVFYPKSPLAKYCSRRCRNESYILRREIRRERAREKHCKNCKKFFEAVRSDTMYCSDSCKQEAYRKRISDHDFGAMP